MPGVSPTPRHVVFDFGKVVFDWDPPGLVARWLPEAAGGGLAAEQWAERFFEGFGGDWGEFDRGRIAPGPLAERIAARTGVAIDAARRVIDAVPGELRPNPAMVALIEELVAAGHGVWFLSNMPPGYAEQLEADHPFLGRFAGGLYSGRVGLIKPEREIYDLAAERFGIDPAEALFIDDVPANVDAARAAGWQAIRFVDAPACREALARMGFAVQRGGAASQRSASRTQSVAPSGISSSLKS